MDDWLMFLMVGTSLLIAISSLDDLFIDLLATGIKRFNVTGLDTDPFLEIPRTAVFVANWHEEAVLGRMVEGNLARIQNNAVMLYLGVYPNDEGTLRVAQVLQQKYPSRVKVIVNTLAGPTSKGQMLNEMFQQTFEGTDCPEMVVLHDSEDVIDPRTFAAYAKYAAEGSDFIQVPVFSLDRGKRAYVASTYMDEFAERHTRELVVRDAVGAMIPSAGVGTCLTKALIRHFLATRGQVLMSGTVTEDYILGVETKRAGFRAAFAALSSDDKTGYDFVATREFFPSTLAASIKQKTRWVYGINFEAMHKLGWSGDRWDKYFFGRDRKGIVTNFLPPISLIWLTLLTFGYMDLRDMSPTIDTVFTATIYFNVFALLVRYFIRVSACHQVYGARNWFGIAARWPVALYINMAASYGAWKAYLGESQRATKPIVWSKTAHDLPDDFMTARR